MKTPASRRQSQAETRQLPKELRRVEPLFTLLRDYNFYALGAHIVKHSKCACSPILCYFILGFF